MTVTAWNRLQDLTSRVAPLPWQLLRARLALRGFQRVGPLTRVVRRWPLVENSGEISIGGRGVVNSRFAPVAFVTMNEGQIAIGDRAVINFGVAITAGESISIGDDVTIGPYCIVDDRVHDGSPHPVSAPIRIGSGCWLASRVVVLPGTTIGDGTVLAAGAIVSGDIPARVVYGGAPARVLRQLDATGDSSTS